MIERTSSLITLVWISIATDAAFPKRVKKLLNNRFKKYLSVKEMGVKGGKEEEGGHVTPDFLEHIPKPFKLHDHYPKQVKETNRRKLATPIRTNCCFLDALLF